MAIRIRWQLRVAAGDYDRYVNIQNASRTCCRKIHTSLDSLLPRHRIHHHNLDECVGVVPDRSRPV